MKPTQLGIGILTVLALLSACAPASSTATPTSVPVNNIPVASTATTAPTSAPQQAATPMSLDPCMVIPSSEASSLAGVTFGQGQEETDGTRCVYGANTPVVFNVDVLQAPDVQTAQQNKQAFIADIQSQAGQLASQGLTVTEVPDFADGAVQAELSLSYGGQSISGSAFGFIKGTVFVGMSVVARGQAAPSIDALKGEAQTVMGRLP
jgi:hypothetical protein